jgi:hypothetical protein
MGVKLRGLKETVAMLENLASLEWAKAGLAIGAAYVKRIMAEYPPSPGGRPQFPNGFKTKKQQRYFFWALKNGAIEVPYRRGVSPQSETLGRKWTIEGRHGGMTRVVSNNASYGPIVHSAELQAAYHETTGWITDEEAMEKAEPKTQGFIVERLKQEIP